jgi:hypothetical protein
VTRGIPDRIPLWPLAHSLAASGPPIGTFLDTDGVCFRWCVIDGDGQEFIVRQSYSLAAASRYVRRRSLQKYASRRLYLRDVWLRRCRLWQHDLIHELVIREDDEPYPFLIKLKPWFPIPAYRALVELEQLRRDVADELARAAGDDQDED